MWWVCCRTSRFSRTGAQRRRCSVTGPTAPRRWTRRASDTGADLRARPGTARSRPRTDPSPTPRPDTCRPGLTIYLSLRSSPPLSAPVFVLVLTSLALLPDLHRFSRTRARASRTQTVCDAAMVYSLQGCLEKFREKLNCGYYLL